MVNLKETHGEEEDPAYQEPSAPTYIEPEENSEEENEYLE